MEPRADQIVSFSFADAWSDEFQLAVAILHIDYFGGQALDLRMPLERVLEFADSLAAAICVVVEDDSAGGEEGAVRPFATPPRSTDSDEAFPYPVTGFRFERLADGVTIIFDLAGLDLEALVVAESQQAQHLADYARSWYHRPHRAAIAALAGN